MNTLHPWVFYILHIYIFSYIALLPLSCYPFMVIPSFCSAIAEQGRVSDDPYGTQIRDSDLCRDSDLF